MDVNLYRTRSGWAVKSGPEVEAFPSIEAAADALLSIGIQDDAIDIAVIELHGNNHTRANFGIQGGFVMSDEATLDEIVGIA